MREVLLVVMFFGAISAFFVSGWRIGRLRSHMRHVVNQKLGREAFLDGVRSFEWDRELAVHFRAFRSEEDDTLKRLRRTQIILVLSFALFTVLFGL